MGIIVDEEVFFFIDMFLLDDVGFFRILVVSELCVRGVKIYSFEKVFMVFELFVFFVMVLVFVDFVGGVFFVECEVFIVVVG